MNWREKQLRFSIRKLKVAVASTVVGISVFGVATPAVQANQIVPAQQAAAVNYRYVLESELTDAEKNLIQTQLPSHQVGDYSTYYMVYRPISSKATASLPSTGMEDEQLIAGLGLGLLIIGVSLVAGKKRRVISSIFFLTAAGAVSVSALGGGSLSVYDHGHQLAVGASLPETAITIANHEFVGYILEKAALPAAKPTDGLEEPAQPTEETKPEEPTQPLQPTAPGQPELTTELQEIDFATEIIDDANLSLGQEVVAQEGRKGQKRLTFDGDQLVSEEVLTQPVNRVILRGTKSAEAIEETRLESLPFTTEYQDDPTLAQGEEQVVREGQDGLRQDRYVNGQVVASEVLREPVNRLVKRGTKVDQPAPVESTVYENVAFETIVEPDPTLPLGQEVVVQEGQTGRKESKYLDGQLVSSVILDAPVAQIIRRGTKVDGQEPVETVTYDEVAFESIVEEDPSLPVGEEVLVQAGQVGRKENKFLDGQLVSSQVVQEPVNQIIRKGTRVIEGTVEVSREVELPFDTKVVADDSQYTDYQVTTPGQNGKAIVIDTYRTVNGVQVGLPISSRQETLVAPVDQVLTVGTKPIVDKTTVETLIEVQPDLETKYDDSQYADYKVTTPGQAGQIKRTETYVTVKGEKTGLPLDSKDEVISPATPTVVTIGTKPLEGTVDLSRLVELAFGTDTVTDENQYEDFTETIPGTPGQQEIIETFKTLKGEKIGEPIATAEGAVIAPVNAKIVTGTKPIVGSVEETREEEIAFTTETQYDDTKYTDYISETPGQLGAKILTEAFQTIKGEKVGQPTIKEERVTKEPVNHVIIIGTKPIEDTVLETRTEAYTVEPETRYAEEEYEDYSVEIEGIPGTKEISERFQTIKGEKVGQPSLVGETILVPATPKVFLIGSKAIEGQVTETRKEVIEPETVIVYDDTKYEDYREEVAGTPGEKEVTETFRTLKGDKTEIILESSEQVLAEPIAKQIILGRMALAGVESTERIMEVAYVTRLVEDPDQYFGYRKEEGGTPGQTKVYETYQTIKGVRTGEPTLDREEVLTAPVDLVVTVGVKPIVATEEDRQVIALPFNTETVKDETKYTDYREVTPGQDGQLERVTTYRTVRGQRVGEPISVVDKTLNEPVDEVITIGTKEIEGEITLPPRTEERDFAVEEIKDPDRYTDYYHEEGGVKGEVEITETFKTIKGQIEGNPIKSEERVITAPVKKVIIVGTKPLNGQTQVVREEAIPFDTEVKYDKDQYEDYAVETGGTPGKAEITETYNTFKGEAIGQPTASERVVKEKPVNNIRTVGTKPINWTETVVDKVALPFDTIEETDADQYEDYEVVRVEGVDGEKTITTVYKTVKGVRQPDPTITEETTKPVVNKVIVKGTKSIYGEKEVTRTEPVDFTTREVKDPNQYTDYRKEEGGVDGVKTITEVFKTEKGQVTTELLRSSEAVTIASIEKVITVGTKPIYGEKEVTRTEPVDFTTREVKDPDQYTDYRKEEGGVAGVKTITEVFKTEKGELTTELLRSSEAVTTAPIEKVITVGTKPIYGEKPVISTEPIPVTEEIQLDPNKLASSPDEVLREGTEGIQTITKTYKTEKGVIVGDPIAESSAITTPMETRLIKRGTKVLEAEKQEPRAVVQTVAMTAEPIAEQSIQPGLENVRSYTWKENAKPSTTESIDSVSGTVIVTYNDGSTDEVPVTIIVRSEADKQAPAAKEPKQVVGLNSNPSAEASIDTTGLTNVRSYDWLGSAPTTTASNPDATGTVRVTYIDGSYDDIPVSIIVQSESDKQAPTARADQQVLGLNQTPVPSASIATEGLTNVRSYDWLGSAPTTTASNPNATGTVRVTYTDGSYDDVPVSIIVQSEADKQAPIAKADQQVLGLNQTPVPSASIATEGLTNVANYTWVGEAPSTAASNANVPATVRVTYTDGSYDDVPVSIKVVSEADKQAPAAKVDQQVLGLNQTPVPSASIATEGLTNVASYTWVGEAPSTAASNANVPATVRVTYTDGSYDDVPVSIKVVSEADKQAPAAKADQQVLGLNQTPVPSASIATEGLTNVASYTWVGEAPSTVASNTNVPATVRVTYTDGSYDDVPVSIKVVSEADKQAPAAKEPKQVVGLNSTPSAEASIETSGLTNVDTYTWLGSAPATTASNPNATGTVRVTYTDGSYDDVPVSITVQSESDKQAPTAKEPKQVVSLNSTPSAEASIETSGLSNVDTYTWVGSAPATTASNPNATGTVRVTYTDGSYDDVPVSIIVQSESDKQNPTAKAEKQVVGLNVTPDPEASINTTGLERVRSYTWKSGAIPVTTASNPAVTGTVLVTYEDASVDEVSVEVIVRSESDKQNPIAKEPKQVVGLNSTPSAEASIETSGLTNVDTYTWLGSAPATTASNPNATGTVRVTYTDGSYDDVLVSITVQSEADKQNPTAKAEKQVVDLNSTPSAEASIETSGLSNVDTYTWVGSAPTTTASNPNATGTVRVTYTDGSYDDVPVSITVQSEADKQDPTAKAEKQVVGLNSTPSAEASIETSGLSNVDTYTWVGSAPTTTASNPNATGTVRVTYTDGSYDDVPVSITVQSEADKQNPTAKAEKQVVGLNVTPDPEASINTTGLERVRSYTWKPGATPVTTASNPAATGTVLVTYEDGSVDEVAVDVTVQSEADKQNPTAKAEKQVVGLNVTPDPEASINTTGLERVRSYTWKSGATPVTTASNPAATGTVLVTYEDGSVDEVSVEVIVRSEADKQNPTAKAEKQVVGLNVTPDPEASINTTGLERVRSYTWKPGATPVTTASNPAATGIVLVTYEDGSVDEVAVDVIAQSEADKQNPTAKAEKQVVGLNVAPDPEASINTTGLERVRSYTWKPGATPVTTASNPAATGTVLVTYEDGSVDEVAVDVVVQSDADRQTPRPIVQKVNLKDTTNPGKSIEAGLPTGTSYAWKDGVAPVTTASTMASGQGVAGTVIVTYPDGSKDEVQVTVQVESDADRGNPTPATVKQSVKVDQQPVAADSINKEGLAKAATYEWQTAPDTSAAVTDLDAIVVVTYEDGSKDEVPVKIDVLPNKTKPTLVLEKLTELDDDKKINLNYELTDPTNAKTSITYEIYNGTEKVKEGTVDSNNPFDVDGLDWHIPYTLKTTLTYDLGQGPVVETLEDVPFELDYKRVELRHVDAAELYHKQPDGSYSRIDKLSEAPTNFDDYYVKVVDDQQKDIYLAVTKVEDSTVGDRATFKFTAVAPQLIEHNTTKTDNVENYTFHVPKVVPSEPGKPRTFADLVAAMTANPTARIELTEDLDVGNFALANNAASYIPGNFNGQLIGNNFSIKGLKAPLFENTGTNFRAQDIFLKDVAINLPAQSNFGALAKASTGGVISNVAVQGTLNGDASLAGLVAKTTNTRLENVAFTGAITSTNQWNYNYTAGIVGQFEGASVIDKAIVDAKITVTLNQNLHVKGVGAVVGRANNTVRPEEGNIRNVVATGSVTNTWNAETNIGGVIGEVNQNNLRLRNVVSSVNVTRGQSLIGKMGVATNVMNNTVVLVEGTTATGTNNAPTSKTATEAAAQVESMGITVKPEGSSHPNINKYDVDFSTVAGYNSANDLKYANTEKLLPFYNKEFIVKQGNLLTTGRLATDKVVSVVPMVDNKTVSDYLGQKDAINKLLVHYADGTVEELTLSFKETFKDTGIQEYRVNGGEVLFTPNQMTNRNQEIVDAVKATLQGLDYYDTNILTKLKKTLATGETATDAMDKLYLKESFNEVKGKIGEVLSGILATSNVVTTSNQELTKFITDNKEELMIGLAYVNRWYNINFGDFNAKDLILNNQDFYGKPVDTLNFLVNLAKGGYNDIRAHNNVATYEKHFAPLTGKATLFDYLGDLRKKFTEFETDAEWFNATTTAHIVETKSVHRPDLDMSAYNRMVKATGHQNGVLPLLTAQEGIYILSNMATLSYGMFDRYFDMNLKNTDPATYATKVEEVKAKANEAGHLIGVYFDTWYRLNPNRQKDALDNSIPVWDAYSNSKGTYLKRWGDVDTNQAVQDFFGPILPDITATTNENRRGYHIKINNGSSGIAYGDYVTYMLTFNLLDKRGLSIFTHENIHNMENKVYMGGFDRRLGIMPEFYPLGVLQAPEGGVPTNTKLAFNTMFDFTANVDDTTRLVNASPDRFQNQGDLQEYLKGSFDVLYLLDYAEATSILSKDTATKQKFWAKIENNYRANSGITNAFAVNTIRPLTAEEATSLTTLDDLINQSILGRRETWNGNAKQELTRNGYFRLGMFAPIYSALSNPDGSPGDFMFRRMAFELLAEKGYDQGFLPYASNQLGTEAAAQNRYGTDDWWFNRRMPFPTDEMIFKHIFGNTYADWNAFKKDMFQQRIAKKDQLKPITITYQGRTETINSFDRLQALMTEAVDYDARTANSHDIRISRVHALKAAIYNAYLRQSKDFEESIFNN